MGKRGPQKQSEQANRLRGNPGKRSSAAPVVPAPGEPDMPLWVRPDAQRFWGTLVSSLRPTGYLSLLDGIALGLLCEALEEYVGAGNVVAAAAAKEDAVRFILTTTKGNIVQHPAVGVRSKAWERLVKLLRDFGMTPASRIEGASPPNPEEDEMGSLLKQLHGSKN